MKSEIIKKREDEFFSTLTNSAGVKYKLTQTTDIENGVKIYSIRPDFSSYYYASGTVKKSICLHFTVGYIKSDVTALSTKDNHVSASYVVDRCGRIYELFPDSDWSYHLGSGSIGGNGAMSKQSIAIEISNYGPLKQSGEYLVDSYGNNYCLLSENEFYYKQCFRGYEYYASMTDAQISATAALIKYLVRKHNIPMNFKPDDTVFTNDAEAIAFRGIFYHTNVRKDKFDWPFGPSLKAVIDACSDVLPQVEESKVDAVKTEPEIPLETLNLQETVAEKTTEEPGIEISDTEIPKAEIPDTEISNDNKSTESIPITEIVKTAEKKTSTIKPKTTPKVSSPKNLSTKSTSLLESLVSWIYRLFGNKL